jgi:hypothetical protein
MTTPNTHRRAICQSAIVRKALLFLAFGAAIPFGSLRADPLPNGVIQRFGTWESDPPVAGSNGGSGSGSIVGGGTATTNVGFFDIAINPGAALSGNAAALAAFNRAAEKWEFCFSDPITVTIDANLVSLSNPNIIGQASSVLLMASYDFIRDQLVADSALDADDAINAFLPTSAQFSALVPVGFSLDGNLVGTKANLKAMGFGGLDTLFGPSDATIEFNSNFAFDYDNSDGVMPGTIDFETVAIHEIGHALGFISAVDLVDASPPGAFSPEVLDLFRFRDGSANDPSLPAEFTNFARDLTPNTNAITDFVLASLGGEPLENRMSTGVLTGDGRQASHWKDDGLTGLLVGVMDPTLPFGLIENISASDARALDLIGYDRVVPEPGSMALLAAGLVGLARRSRPGRRPSR